MNRCGKAAHFRPKQGRGSSQRQRLVIVTGVVSFGESTRDRARPNRHQGLSVFAWPGWRGFSYGHEQGTRGDSRPQIIGRVPANHAAGPRSFIGDTLFFFSSYGPSPAVETSIKTNISRIAVEQRVAPLELVFLFFFFFFFCRVSVLCTDTDAFHPARPPPAEEVHPPNGGEVPKTSLYGEIRGEQNAQNIISAGCI